MKRPGLLLVVLLVGAASMAGAATTVKPPLKLLGISRWNPDPTWAPIDTSVQKAVAAAANAWVGRTVTVTWGRFPPDTTYLQFLQMREAAGTLPEILLLDDLHHDAEAYEYAIRKGLITSYTLADVSKNMPGYVARFRQYGADVSYAISENTKNTGEAGTGRLWYLPFQFGSASFPAAKVPNDFSRPSPDRRPRGRHVPRRPVEEGLPGREDRGGVPPVHARKERQADARRHARRADPGAGPTCMRTAGP